MNPFTHFHFIYKFCLVVFLSFAFWSCQSNQNNQKVNDLVREGNDLLKQEEAITSKWKAEFGKVFTPENRAKFPSNREMLRLHAENQIRLLEQRKALHSSAADKFEQASNLSNNEKEKRFTSLFAASFKTDVEIDRLFQKQMKLVIDNGITDSTTFERKFKDLTRQIEMKVKDRDELQSEGKRVVSK